MIQKPSILITSLGRTGTEFFGNFFADILPDSTSLHEPDIFQNTGVDNKWRHYFQQVRQAGLWRMGILKALGKWTLVNLSDDRFRNRISLEHAAKELLDQRAAFIRSQRGSIYVEANIGYYGLLDVTSDVFQSHRAVFILRDGRDWVRSHMNWGEFYGKHGIRKFISHNWPSANQIDGDPYAEQWEEMTRFERLCWAWTRLNEFALKTLEGNANARVFRFEEIFLAKERYQTLNELVSFVSNQPAIDAAMIKPIDGWLERRSHQSSAAFPAWAGWSQEHKRIFLTHCEELSSKLGYL
ncbi:MAG: hypothetical protein LC099_03615 [Anaerolineales bacterium]|nr:hypothetical protein [Anaerolineales bacterium]